MLCDILIEMNTCSMWIYNNIRIHECKRKQHGRHRWGGKPLNWTLSKTLSRACLIRQKDIQILITISPRNFFKKTHDGSSHLVNHADESMPCLWLITTGNKVQRQQINRKYFIFQSLKWIDFNENYFRLSKAKGII